MLERSMDASITNPKYNLFNPIYKLYYRLSSLPQYLQLDLVFQPIIFIYAINFNHKY